ncbi:hypothetical protein F8388_013526 [Cannabis sativa]|uniref:Uncharacterized protein n=1 Tax=Cannabis sativa TaxID=3483 RepID=A0A7J6G909_CANSA|nr:hypothetical protein F8388_013526 [Cannabis sativa]
MLMINVAFCSNNSSIPTHISGCTNQLCGDFEIPYPFGLDKGCFMEPPYLFQIYCKNSKPYLFNSGFSVSKLSVAAGEVTLMLPIAQDCYTENGTQLKNNVSDFNQAFNQYFSVSFVRNKFYSIGCDNLATINGFRGDNNYTTGCISSCSYAHEVDLKSCSGVGCCKTSIPSGLNSYRFSLRSNNHHRSVWSFNPCSYSFFMEETEFNFSKLEEFTNLTQVPVMVDFAVGFESCEVAKKNMTSYACKENTVCVDSIPRDGYLCWCSKGYEGNPFLDVDECKKEPNLCKNGICQNTPGSFKCLCQKGYLPQNETMCIDVKDNSRNRIVDYIIVSVSMGFVAIMATIATEDLKDTTKIFTLEEIKKATNNFHESRILGEGGYGIVYKGELMENIFVAIKKSKVGIQTQIEQFINEMIVLMQINHKNVVKLFGYCLETEVPLLIASETAGALAYLHSQTITQIIHRDVKTANILLDENYIAKVSDFGASRLNPLDQDQLQTLVQGTFGYLDPEYMYSSNLTDKSDVYSFGAVLAELLTSMKAIDFRRDENDRNLANYFVSALKGDRILDIFDADIVSDANVKALMEVANLAGRCLRVKSDERPTMKEVAMELEGLRAMEKHQQREANFPTGETKYLVESPLYPNCIHNVDGESINNTSADYVNIQNELLNSYNSGR